ncbi:hypothetical protein F5H01DRAFT_204201 [Linnemannia elongata]|nr:hypothetical protein F5H01DRAFT_204201 [Linnemannia elongata]
MIKQHSFPQSLQSFITSSFYSCNLILSVHTQDSLVLHFFFIKSVVSISPFSVSLFSFSLFLSLLSSFCLLFLFCLPSFVLFSLPSFYFFFVSLLSSFFFMSLSAATHSSFASLLPHESPPFCTSFLFSFLLSSPSPSLSIVLLVTHLLVFFLIPTYARNYPPRNLPFLTHLTTSPSSFFPSPSRYFFSLSYSSLSPVLCFYFLSIYSSPTPFFSRESTFLLSLNF